MNSPSSATERFPRIQVINRTHPHFEEYGRFTGVVIMMFGDKMAEVALEHCRHGMHGCFVFVDDVEQVPELLKGEAEHG